VGLGVIEGLMMSRTYRTLRIAPSDEGVLGVVIDTPHTNLIGPELVRDLVGLAARRRREGERLLLETRDARLPGGAGVVVSLAGRI
jgi:hypothetical protein